MAHGDASVRPCATVHVQPGVPPSHPSSMNLKGLTPNISWDTPDRSQMKSRLFAIITTSWDKKQYFRFDPNILGSLPPKKPNAADGNFRLRRLLNTIAKKRRIVKRKVKEK